MKLFAKIRFAIDMIVESPLNFMISVLLSGIGLALIGFTLLVYLAGNNGIRSAEKVLTQGVEHTGIVKVDDFYLDTGLEFRKQAFDSEIIHSIGAFNYIGHRETDFQELYNIQHNNEINQSDTGIGFLQMLNVDKELLSLCALDFEKDKLQEYMENSDGGVQYLYLGNAYRDIPVGTEFQDDYQKYKVAGILKKNTSFASTDLSYGVDFTTLRSDVDMDYEIICVNDDASTHWPWMFSVNKNYTMEEGVEELEQIAERIGIKIEEYPLQSLFDKARVETQIMQESLLEMLVLMLIVISIIVTSLQIVEIFHHSRSYGILYSVGFLTPEILVMMIIRNIIYFVFSLCVGMVLLFAIGNKFFITNMQMKDMFFKLLSQQVLPIGIVLMLTLFVIMTVIPCVVFNRQDPVDLVQKI